MEKGIKDQVKAIINNQIENSEEKRVFLDVIARLTNEDFVKKKDILASMVNYMKMIEFNFSNSLDAFVKTSINNEVLKETNDQYTNYFNLCEKESKEINEMMDSKDYPKATKIENNSKYLEMLIRHEKEIDSLT